MHNAPNSSWPRRRAFLTGGAALGLAAAVGGAGWLYVTRPAAAGPNTLLPEQAHKRVDAGDLVLVDIREPEEWAATGIAQGAVPLDMRRSDFVQRMEDLLEGDRNRAVGVICARGVRSRWTVERLREAGFGQVYDVPEGMLGSRVGPGWLATELPVTSP